MDFTKLAEQIKTVGFENYLGRYVPTKTRDKLLEMNAYDIEKLYNKIFPGIVNAEGETEWDMMWLYYRAAWYDLFTELDLPLDMNIYEIATGDTICVPQALDIYSAGHGKYVTLNLNKELSLSFTTKTKDMAIYIRLIEDNGTNILNYYDDGTFNVVAFQHAINDIVQTIVSDAVGIDTLNTNWWETEPQMLRAVYSSFKEGKLKGIAYDPFINIIKVCYKSLKNGGYMIFNNFTRRANYEELGYSSKFHSNYINMARDWIAEANLGLEEIEIDGYDKKWWMVLRK